MRAKFKKPYAKKKAKSTFKKPGRKNATRSVVPRTIKGGYSPNYATITETIKGGPQLVMSTPEYITISLLSTSLRAYPTALQYQEYRLAKVRYVYKPLYNQFNETATTSATIPFLWLKRFPTGNPSTDVTSTLDDMAALGVKPLQFSRKIIMSYKPNLIQSAIIQDNGGTANDILNITPIFNKWLSTNNLLEADTTRPQYQGHLFQVQQNTAVALTPIWEVDVEQVWEFRKPNLVPFYNPGSPSNNIEKKTKIAI